MTSAQPEKLSDAALQTMISLFEELALQAGAVIMPFPGHRRRPRR